MKPHISSSDPLSLVQTLSHQMSLRGNAQSHMKTFPSDRSVLETLHPGIAHAITLLWGHPEMDEYFSKLWLADDRQMPIHPEAMSELMLLARVHEACLPSKESRKQEMFLHAPKSQTRRSNDVWELVGRRR
jgi:hypothetical protein